MISKQRFLLNFLTGVLLLEAGCNLPPAPPRVFADRNQNTVHQEMPLAAAPSPASAPLSETPAVVSNIPPVAADTKTNQPISPVNPPPKAANPPPEITAEITSPKATPKPAAAAVRKLDLAMERQKLFERDAAFSEAATAKGRAQASDEFMCSDAVLLQNGEVPAKGIEIIKVRLSAGPQGTLTWKPEEAEVGSDGELGYTWGNYEFRSKFDGKVIYGKYVTVWKKQEGAWRVALSAVNSSPAPGGRRSELGAPSQ